MDCYTFKVTSAHQADSKTGNGVSNLWVIRQDQEENNRVMFFTKNDVHEQEGDVVDPQAFNKSLKNTFPHADTDNIIRASLTMNSISDHRGNYGPLFARLFALMENVSHGVVDLKYPASANNCLLLDQIAQDQFLQQVANISYSDEVFTMILPGNRPPNITDVDLGIWLLSCQAKCGMGPNDRGISSSFSNAITLYVKSSRRAAYV